MLLAMNPAGGFPEMEGERTKEPAFGLPAVWISELKRQDAVLRGYTVVDLPSVLITHMTELVREHLPELLSYAETQKLLDGLAKEHQRLVGDLVPVADHHRRGAARAAEPARGAGVDPRPADHPRGHPGGLRRRRAGGPGDRLACPHPACAADQPGQYRPRRHTCP